MSEETPERGTPLTPEQRSEQIRLAKERAVAARASRESGGGQEAAAAPPQVAAAAPAGESASAPEPAAAERTPVSPADRAEQIRVARERAAAARAARESGAPPPSAQAAAAEAPGAAAAAEAAPAARAERAAPASPEERAAAIEAAKQRAAAARASRETGAPTPAAPSPAARPAMSPEERAAALAQAQERAAAIRTQRAAAAAPAGATATAPSEPVPTWRVGPGGARMQVLTARPEPHARELATMDAPSRMVLRRRDFLRGGFWAGFAVLAVGGLATFLDFFNPRDITGFGGVVTIPSQNVPKPGDEPFHYLEGKLWLINLKPGEGVPKEFESFAPPSEKGGLLALYHKCVHLGCTVPWRADFQFGGVTGWFRCPCHGSTYTKGGVRVYGPAPRSLDTFLVTKVDPNGVSVNTGKITLGNTADPQRTVDAGPYKS